MSNCQYFFFVGVIAVFCGCGTSDTGEVLSTVSVSGTVSFNGKPLEYHKVTFIPENSRPASGVSDVTGKFVLGTNRPGDGAVVGKHKVSVVYVGPPETNPEAGMNDFSGPPPPKVKIPPKYNDPAKSGIEFDIPSGGKTDLVIELK
jgi:hypothetical protein